MEDDVIAQFWNDSGRKGVIAPKDDSAPEKRRKMMDCPNCKMKNRIACFKCMNDYYNHMHDSDGRRLNVPARLDR